MTTSKAFDELLSQDELSKVEIDRSIEPVKSARRVKPDEALRLIEGENLILGGLPRLNIRTRNIEVRGVEIPSNDISRLYMRLSSPTMIWSKELAADAVTEIAKRNSYDPVVEYLQNLSHIKPLEDRYWDNLDKLLFGINDPIARQFMKRYLVAAVKRPCEPASEYRQIPVLIGKQWIGKTKLGKILFGKYFGSGIKSSFSVDDATKLERLWCCELAELDGLTRTAQIEAFKDFVSRTEDYERRKYGRDTEKIPRRNVFWGTANNPPLNDKSGSSRFVCIALPEVPLPIEEVKKAFNAIWARAYQEYQSGYQCYSTAEEMKGIQQRNISYSIVDPWHDSIENFLEKTALSMYEYSLIYEHLNLDTSRRKNLDSIRIRQIMESLDFTYKRRRKDGKQIRGFYKNEC